MSKNIFERSADRAIISVSDSDNCKTDMISRFTVAVLVAVV